MARTHAHTDRDSDIEMARDRAKTRHTQIQWCIVYYFQWHLLVHIYYLSHSNTRTLCTDTIDTHNSIAHISNVSNDFTKHWKFCSQHQINVSPFGHRDFSPRFLNGLSFYYFLVFVVFVVKTRVHHDKQNFKRREKTKLSTLLWKNNRILPADDGVVL